MTRIIVALYGIAAALAALYPALSEAGIWENHNETLALERR